MNEHQPSEYQRSLDPSRQQAVEELTKLVGAHFSLRDVAVVPGEDNPDATHVIATVDIDDPDEVADLVMERMLEIQLDEGIPVYVIPIRTPERVTKLLQQQHRRTHPLVSLPLSQP
ncbi:MAG: hypothetical protein ACR2GA_06920 [Chloroflexota bacterium]